ncbi:MAG: hypothetical protein IJZ84_01510 [Lachnospiraceae bacterium]|nr:hypothetical protein [Lachnospiraceae bacterium]
MLGFIFTILLFVVFGKILLFSIKATWSIAKIVVSVVLLPLFLVGLVLSGLIAVALPVLVVVGIITFAALRD